MNGGKPYVEDPVATKLRGIPGPLVESQGKNLVKGGGFERTYGDGWLFSPSTAFLDAIVKADGSVKPHEGKKMLRMGTDPETSASKAITDLTAVRGDTLYELSFWTYGPPDSTFDVTVSQNVNVYPTSSITLLGPANNGGWRITKRRFTTHRLCSAVTVRLTDPTSTMYLDDVRLHEVTGTTIHPAEGIYENGECEDKTQLLAETKMELKRRSKPTISYEADVLAFARSGTDLHNVGLGDRVLLVNTTFTPALRLAGRVLQLEEDLLDPALTCVTIGNIIERFTASNRTTEQRLDRVVAESAAWNTSSQQISNNANKWDQVAQTVVDNADQWADATATVNANAAGWNAASETVTAKQSGWDTAAATVDRHAGEWSPAAETVTEGKAKWDEAADTVTRNASAWNEAGLLVQSNKDAWTDAALAVSKNQAAWDRASTDVTLGKTDWGEAYVTAANLAQAVRQSADGTTLRHGDLEVNLGDKISLTDQSGTWVFENGTFVKQ